MRQGNNSRRLRGRPNRKQQISPRAQIYDSHGPDVRIRGNAPQVFEKYLQLARDATSAGNRVGAESFFQFAEHYFRIMNDSTDPQRPVSDPQRTANESQRANLDDHGARPDRPFGGDEQPHVDWPENANTGNGHDRNPAKRPQEQGSSDGSARPSGDARAPEGRVRREPRTSRSDSRDPELPLEGTSGPAVEEAQTKSSAEAVAEPTTEVETKPLPVPVVEPEEAAATPAATPATDETPVEPEPSPRRGRPRTKRAAGTGNGRKTATKATRKTKKSAEDEKPEGDADPGETEEVSA